MPKVSEHEKKKKKYIYIKPMTMYFSGFNSLSWLMKQDIQIIQNKKTYHCQEKQHDYVITTLNKSIADFNVEVLTKYFYQDTNTIDSLSVIHRIASLTLQFAMYTSEIINFALFTENLGLKKQFIKNCVESLETLDHCDKLNKNNTDNIKLMTICSWHIEKFKMVLDSFLDNLLTPATNTERKNKVKQTKL